MSLWKKEYERVKVILQKLGWRCVKDEAGGLENWYSQGVLYANFSKEGKAIHVEYGDEGVVFGEEIEP